MAKKKTRKQRKKHNKNLHDTAMGELLSMIKYKTEWYGRGCTVIDQFFPSTKMCSKCGHIMDELDTSVRFWICPECGTVHDRDGNAAHNIEVEGKRLRLQTE